MHAMAQYIRQTRMSADAIASSTLLMAPRGKRRSAPIAGLTTSVPTKEATGDRARLRVAINLLTENPVNPSGAHWFWTRMVPEMAVASTRAKSST